MAKFSLASGMTPTRGGKTCRAPSPDLKITCNEQKKLSRATLSSTLIVLVLRIYKVFLTKLCLSKSLAKVNDEEDMSINTFNSA